MITLQSKGDYSKAFKFLERMKEVAHVGDLDKYGREGVEALSANTPTGTGLLASSWYYTIERSGTTVSLNFCNSDIEGGVPIAIIIQYGHGTRGGTYVKGRDYINPAIRPIFDKIVEDIGREVQG